MADINNSVLDILYSAEKSPLEFHFDNLNGPFVRMFFSEYEVSQLYEIATSDDLAGSVKTKKKLIDDIVSAKGFQRKWSGTNRIIYRHMEDYSFLLKVAFDNVGLTDSLREYENQFYLKPFCCKVFDVHSTGVLSTVETVVPIRTINEFAQVCDNVYDLIANKIIGKYVLDDIGCLEYFQNYGVRRGFGVVLLDFPYMYKLDGNKLYCSQKDRVTGRVCNGEIDYDETFDNLLCTKCGKKYFARDLSQNIENDLIYLEGESKMTKVYEVVNGNVRVIGGNQSDYIERENERRIPPTQQQRLKGFIPMKNSKKMFSDEIELFAIEDEPTIGESMASQFVQVQEEPIPVVTKAPQSLTDFVYGREPEEIITPIKVIEDDFVMEESSFIKKKQSIKLEPSTFIPQRETITSVELQSEINLRVNEDEVLNEVDLSNLGEIISSNQIDEEPQDLSMFNLTDKDFEEPEYKSPFQQEYYEDQVEQVQEKIFKPTNNENDYLY